MFTGVCWYWTLCNLSMVYDYFKPQIAACCQNNTIYFTLASYILQTPSERGGSHAATVGDPRFHQITPFCFQLKQFHNA